MAVFKTFDPDTKEDADKSLSLLEKGLILSGVLFAKMLLRKIRKAKTYGDLYKITDFFGAGGPVEAMAKKYKEATGSDDDAEHTPEEVESMITDINKLSDKL